MSKEIQEALDDVMSFINENRACFVTVSEDKMSATIDLVPKEDKSPYTVQEIKDILNENNVIIGIDEKAIQNMIDQEIYYVEYEVARGIPPKDGEDAHYKYHFNLHPKSSPELLADGSVDYRNLQYFEPVKKDQLIAEYVNETIGEDGCLVTGEVVACKRGRSVPPIHGKYIVASEDKRKFYSAIDGKIELNTFGNVVITNVMEINGDVDVSTGNVSFSGDVEISGCVRAGFQVEAGGSITVKGIVEAAVLKAGRDVILRSGMAGAGKGIVIAGGNVEAKFFEQTNIDAEGHVHANVLMHCYVNCKDEVVVQGKNGVIIGGRMHALRNVVTQKVGNIASVATYVKVGIDPQMLMKLNQIQNQISKLTKELADIEKIQKALGKVEVTQSKLESLSEKKTLVMRSKIVKVTERDQLVEQLKKLEYEIEQGKGARVTVNNSVYEGVVITINGQNLMIKEPVERVIFALKSGHVVMMSLV